ncbi:MAG TPA: alanine--tRNA ligase [Candidatus Limnocylindria bacterium]|nr:alanine--tRNA ligase [Candidatus Limnocylindria bacterium]
MSEPSTPAQTSRPTTAAEIREAYQRFFEERGHTRVPPAPLLARDDPTLLFVNSGMAPFKRVLTGEEKRDYVRAVDAQPVLRVAGKHNDFEEVGRTPRHHTLFEMLGNWSFGDYFKREAIHWAWEFMTDTLGIPPDRIAATVYTDDDEAHRIWAEEIGLPPDRLVRWGNIAAGDEKNFWRMGETGPCGPCSELHYDRGAHLSEGPECVPDHSEHCPRWLEVWNLVFMEFDRAADGSLTPLPFRSVDTGMGLERIASVVQGVDSNYQTDVFRPIIDRLAESLGHRPEDDESVRFAYQVVADHSRAMTFLIAEGVKPANEGAGYVLRRLIRRAVRYVRLMGITKPFLREACEAVIEIMDDAYPHLVRERDRILAEVEDEEARFARTLDAGLSRLEELIAEGGTISGADAFRLHDTFGFPIDLTVELAAERGVTVDRAGFEAAMAEQRERSRGEKRAALRLNPEVAELRSEFIGYPNETEVDGLRVLAVLPGEPAAVICDRTPFYPEGGGQIGDRGQLIGPNGRLRVEDTQRSGDAIVHLGTLKGELNVGDEVRAEVDAGRRWGAARNHTATHLLHRALRDVLGEQAKQAGSYVGPEGLRFDFPAEGPTPREALREVERIVNAQIRRDAPVKPELMPMAEAQKLGADMFFGEKYLPESVRVVQVDGYSKELCGGTHVAHTGQIGTFVITGESSIGAGLRRIEAVTGEAAVELIGQKLDALRAAAQLLGEREENVPARIETLLARLREAEKAAKAPRAAAARLDVSAALESAQEAGKTKVIVQSYPEADTNQLRTLADDLRGATGRFVAVLGGSADGKPALLVAASRDLAAEGFDSVAIVRAAASHIGGGGGGRSDLAQAGGRDAAGLDAALREAGRLALEALQRIESA